MRVVRHSEPRVQQILLFLWKPVAEALACAVWDVREMLRHEPGVRQLLRKMRSTLGIGFSRDSGWGVALAQAKGSLFCPVAECRKQFPDLDARTHHIKFEHSYPMPEYPAATSDLRLPREKELGLR